MKTTKTPQTYIVRTVNEEATIHGQPMYLVKGPGLTEFLDQARTFEHKRDAKAAADKYSDKIEPLIVTTPQQEEHNRKVRDRRRAERAAQQEMEARYPWLTKEFWAVVAAYDTLLRDASVLEEQQAEMLKRIGSDDPHTALDGMHWKGEAFMKTAYERLLVDELLHGLSTVLRNAQTENPLPATADLAAHLKDMETAWTCRLYTLVGEGESSSPMANLDRKFRAVVLADQLKMWSLHSYIARCRNAVEFALKN